MGLRHTCSEKAINFHLHNKRQRLRNVCLLRKLSLLGKKQSTFTFTTQTPQPFKEVKSTRFAHNKQSYFHDRTDNIDYNPRLIGDTVSNLCISSLQKQAPKPVTGHITFSRLSDYRYVPPIYSGLEQRPPLWSAPLDPTAAYRSSA